MKELLDKKFETRDEIMEFLVKESGFKKASEEEKEKWPYKNDLSISPTILVGKELFSKKESVGIVEEVIFSGKCKFKLKTKNGEYSLTGSKAKIYNPLYKEEQLMDLHPSRGGLRLWNLGYVIKEKDYKKLYYNTREYRDKYEKGLNENYGTSGITSPVQIKEVRDKISDTIEKKYGVPWFLKRGAHYSAVTETMIHKYGVENLFYSEEWQDENRAQFPNGVSKLELSVIGEIVKIPGLESSFYYGEGNKQANFVCYENNKNYRVDFFNKDKKIVVEIHGDFWHCNPKLYSEDFYHKFKKKTAKQIWEEEKIKRDLISEKYDCKYFVIWEKDWNEDSLKVIRKLKNTINE